MGLPMDADRRLFLKSAAMAAATSAALRNSSALALPVIQPSALPDGVAAQSDAANIAWVVAAGRTAASSLARARMNAGTSTTSAKKLSSFPSAM